MMFSIESFIEVVRGKPMLWNLKHKDFRDYAARHKTWQEVAGIFADDPEMITANFCQKKFKNLRDAYRTYLIRLKQNKSRKPYRYADLLTFLDEDADVTETNGYDSNNFPVVVVDDDEMQTSEVDEKPILSELDEQEESQDEDDQISILQQYEQQQEEQKQKIHERVKRQRLQILRRCRLKEQQAKMDQANSSNLKVHSPRTEDDQSSVRNLAPEKLESNFEDEWTHFGQMVACKLRRLPRPVAENLEIQILQRINQAANHDNAELANHFLYN